MKYCTNDENCTTAKPPLVDRHINKLTLKEKQWQYRGEGNANIVISLPEYRQILRIRKTDSKSTGYCLFEWLKQLFCYTERREIERESRDLEFYRKIMAPLVGEYFAQPARLVKVPSFEIKTLNNILTPARPEKRKGKRLQSGHAALFFDYAFLPPDWLNNENEGSVYAVELKPKQGWIPLSDRVLPKCQFCMYQYYKQIRFKHTVRGLLNRNINITDLLFQLQNGDVTFISNYCPVDLFSGDFFRMKIALRALLNAPQNNLRIFRNGNLVYGDGIDCTALKKILFDMFPDTSKNINLLIDNFCTLVIRALTKSFYCASRKQCNHLIKEVYNTNEFSFSQQYFLNQNLETTKCNYNRSKALPQGCVLNRILQIQQLDLRGLNGIYSFYEYLMKKYPGGMDVEYHYVTEMLNRLNNFENVETCPKCFILSQERIFETQIAEEECLENLSYKVKSELELAASSYLLAAVARDCSLMLAFKKLNGECKNAPCSQIIDAADGSQFVVSIGVFDLFPKPLTCIAKHHNRNRCIQKAYDMLNISDNAF